MEWGAQHPDTVIAWHGLARTARDMDDIAAHLAQRFRVICPDTIGRGLSQWSPRPEQEYCLAFYAQLAACAGRSAGARTRATGSAPRWAVPSASRPPPARCAGASAAWCSTTSARRLAAAAIARIRAYAGDPPAFATVIELEAYFRTVYKPYGAMDDAQWRRLTESSTRRLPDGRVTPHYDPAMVMQFTHHHDDYALWPQWDCARPAGAVPARRAQRPAAARGGRCDAQPRPARGGRDHRRLRPCADLEHPRTVRADRTLLRRLS